MSPRYRDPATVGDLGAALLGFVNALLLLDANALYFANQELAVHAPELWRVILAVGDVDAALAIASFRAGTDGWVRPRFMPPDGQVTVTEGWHPLVEQAIPNSMTLAPPHGVLVTGSNMSGKSTWLRTVGVNAVLAQTIHTCLARTYAAPIYQVRTCLGRTDDLIAGKSYYQVEVESVLALVEAGRRPEPHLFLFDELFRGTNAVERIACGTAVLTTLVGDGTHHVVLAATHDNELVDLLRDQYVVCHFGDAVGSEGLVFDYRLTPGPATSRNAITLLELNGAPPSVIRQAFTLAAVLDRQRQQAKTLTPSSPAEAGGTPEWAP